MADYAAMNAPDFDFAEQNNAISRHITLTGTNTLTLKEIIAGYSNAYPRSVMLPPNGNSTVTLDRGLTANLLSGISATRGGNNSMMFVDAHVTGSGRASLEYWSGGSPHAVLRNDANTFSGTLGLDAEQIHITVHQYNWNRPLRQRHQ